MKFECKNCGKSVERHILGLSHAIRGCGMMLDKEMRCCESPVYRDENGVLKRFHSNSTPIRALFRKHL